LLYIYLAFFQMDFLQEFNTIKNELEEAHTAYDWYDCHDYDDHIKYVIHCEYGWHEKPTIHYNHMYGGNEEFNKLLNKYKLLMEWDNPCILLIYGKQEVKNSVAVFLKGQHKENYLKDSDNEDEDYLIGSNMMGKYL